jgi:NADH-quinone oxidoreductase subunit M
MDSYGGVASHAPLFATLFAVAAFASLGLPGLSGFIAEFQVFAGSLGPAPAATVMSLLGILVTAGLFLWAMQRVLLGEPRNRDDGFTDLRRYELVAIAPLLVLSGLIGVFPRWLLDVIEPASAAVVRILGGGGG